MTIKNMNAAQENRAAGWDIPSITESLAADVTSGKITLHDAAAELYRANRLKFIDTEKAAELLGLPSDEPQPSGTQSIQFFGNGIKINGSSVSIAWIIPAACPAPAFPFDRQRTGNGID
ncbi:hypothetical protein D7X33_08425 [Butyricicoccus sp. 1XD8-22]|nr:hypothetical protein D7X33_08425 [Butyricicoccus sp. 1XD8-22]